MLQIDTDSNPDKTVIHNRFFGSNYVLDMEPAHEVPELRRTDIQKSYVKPVTANPKIALLYINDEYKMIVPTLYGRLYEDKLQLETSKFTKRVFRFLPCISVSQREYAIQMITRLLDIIHDAYHMNENGMEAFRAEVLQFIADMPGDVLPDSEEHWTNISTSEIVSRVIEINVNWHFLDERNLLYRTILRKRRWMSCLRVVSKIVDPLSKVVELVLTHHRIKYGDNDVRLVSIWDFMKYRMKMFALDVVMGNKGG